MLKAYHKNDMTFGHISGGQSCETEEGNFYVHLYMFFFSGWIREWTKIYFPHFSSGVLQI